MELFDRTRGTIHPESVHSEAVTSPEVGAEIIADLHAALADGSLSGNELTKYVIDHDEPWEFAGGIIAATCPILREVSLSHESHAVETPRTAPHRIRNSPDRATRTGSGEFLC